MDVYNSEIKMISDHGAAKKISDILLEVSDLLDKSVCIMHESKCLAEEKKNYTTLIGQLMGTIGCDIFNILYKEHPDLKPDEYYLPDNNK
ncbi:hypothetical protein [Salmonella enterica]|uniref:hypothetical protein n=1 Tax=Salmonella enterica TaxID=28901 RepID=UPI003F3E2F38|nr:hypothetical protein [Salmonella enterica]EHO5063619.1 hypothetical protein [Salmonella enterica]EHO5103639.1 hypothetical protein [Salmonella enterica]EHO5919751.1 hypothetical protein [Salmonella enterica]